jgi:hypothetical protein
MTLFNILSQSLCYSSFSFSLARYIARSRLIIHTDFPLPAVGWGVPCCRHLRSAARSFHCCYAHYIRPDCLRGAPGARKQFSTNKVYNKVDAVETVAVAFEIHPPTPPPPHPVLAI